MALENGEFTLPVPAPQLAALREAIRSANPPLDEGFVGTVKAYMKSQPMMASKAWLTCCACCCRPTLLSACVH